MGVMINKTKFKPNLVLYKRSIKLTNPEKKKKQIRRVPDKYFVKTLPNHQWQESQRN